MGRLTCWAGHNNVPYLNRNVSKTVKVNCTLAMLSNGTHVDRLRTCGPLVKDEKNLK